MVPAAAGCGVAGARGVSEGLERGDRGTHSRAARAFCRCGDSGRSVRDAGGAEGCDYGQRGEIAGRDCGRGDWAIVERKRMSEGAGVSIDEKALLGKLRWGLLPFLLLLYVVAYLERNNVGF